MNRYLILCPTGGETNHIADWMQGEVNYDLMLVDYSNAPPGREHRWARCVHRAQGYKTEILYQAIQAHRELVASYAAVWLPDGDLAIAPAEISKMFALFERFQLQLAQPAVVGPHVNLPVTARCPWTLYRHTDFVEVMAPVFRTSALFHVLESFPLSRSAWGIDQVWCELLGYRGVAVLDAVSMEHRKPVDPNSLLYRSLAAHGVDPREEHRRLRGVYQTRGKERTRRWVFAVWQGRELGWGSAPSWPARAVEDRLDVSPRPPGRHRSPWRPGECLARALSQADREWVQLSWTPSLSPEAAELERALPTWGDDLALGIASGTAWLRRSAWSQLVANGFIGQLSCSPAALEELAWALRLAGWRTEGSAWPKRWASATEAQAWGRASVWLDGYRLIGSWPFRHWRERLSLHWPTQLLLALWRASRSRSGRQRAYHWARVVALWQAGFEHSRHVRDTREAFWRGVRSRLSPKQIERNSATYREEEPGQSEPVS